MDQTGFRSFYEKTAPRLRAYIARSCGSIDLADDILQEVFVRFLNIDHDEMNEAGMRAYLYRSADSLIIDNWRRNRREQGRYLYSFLDTGSVEKDLDQDIRRAFSQLKPHQRSLLWLAYVEGCDHREIAVATGVKEKSVRVLLFRARKALLKIMDHFGIGPEVA